MKYQLKLRDDTTKIHPVTVTLPGVQDDAAAIKAGVAHLKDLGLPFNDFDEESDLMGITVSQIGVPNSEATRVLPAPVAKKTKPAPAADQ